MSTELKSALRNQLVLKWLRSQHSPMLALLRENYAAFIQAPLVEVLPFDGSEGLDTNCLVWVYEQMKTDIDAFGIHGLAK